MEPLLRIDLHKEFLNFEKSFDIKRFPMASLLHHSTNEKSTIVEKAVEVCNILKKSPYLSGKQVAERTGLMQQQLALTYKLIQRSDICQKYFKNSNHKDYFNVVKHYFNHRLYTLVFFVGTSCPNRCTFCPNVTIDKQGRRSLNTYQGSKKQTLSETQINRIFDDIATIKKRGMDILIKISGGLEPLTDIRTMDIIIRLSKKLVVPVKLFTNGLLLNDPEKRKIALQTTDIRISLITSDSQQYQDICFPESLIKNQISGLAQLKENIMKLVAERGAINPACRIGFNCVVLPENHAQLISLLELAASLGIDYVDFKPDYFSTYDPEIVSAMEESVHEAQLVSQFSPYNDLYVNFTSSLSRKDLFWRPWQGTCDTQKQSDFKIFITPFGDLSPVHYGAFPKSESDFQKYTNIFSIGRITDASGLLDALEHPAQTPKIEYCKLNPFELMLSLEINREEEDRQWGLPISFSPYHTNLKDEIPIDFFFQSKSEEVS